MVTIQVWDLLAYMVVFGKFPVAINQWKLHEYKPNISISIFLFITIGIGTNNVL